MKDFILPDIGEGIVECELVEWLVEEGDTIVEDQPVADVMTDKALVQIPAMNTGVVKKLYYKKGEIAKVHEPLFAMDVEGESSESDASQVSADTQQQAENTKTQAQSAHTEGDSQSSSKQTEDFILPDIGEGIVECELVEWLVEEGDEISEDQPVADVMTDKALVQIPSKFNGKVLKRYYQKGEIAKVHEPLFAIEIDADTETESASVKSSEKAGTSQPETQEKPQKTDSGDRATSKQEKFPGGEFDPKPAPEGKALASPAVRRLARELDVDLNKVKGSGKKGRVMKQDLHALEQQDAETQQHSGQSVQKASSAPQSTGGSRVEPIRGVGAAMARQMSASVFSIPHFSVSDEIEMDALMAARAQLKPEFEKQGVKLSFMPFIIKAMSLALKHFPVVNSQVNDDCTELTYFDDHNIGMAVDSKIGLLVPNIKGVQNLSLFEVAKEANRLIEQAREGRLPGGDLKGGTISISNVGVIGGTVATPVINKPESAIVALGKIQRLPRFDEQDNVKPVNIMHISWSGDHRIIDGATMVRFSNLWKSYLENPLAMLAEMK
ncbi:dihydrolipoyllysine-residue acetyltransferase [Lacimicrobium alkaliphilum]|uniref:Dihydrolipoamide acetyltransferase component of pyruvate dehydrogenase complex n=1 Tax=Lacimicrobium alkaliphilum TaxID=1526571 RepID=A0ABQ1QYU1_9ALTE|nr:dihydrolipoyllysine-residue acetyltransferase [Lacimicrobium alkaliphilum]GGD52200.1 dihydrolipoamide acetyltransferase component of pyruvate dehydrogenase complex [Lacimicrobium alkaliphilum]